jgi:hypothetical protein
LQDQPAIGRLPCRRLGGQDANKRNPTPSYFRLCTLVSIFFQSMLI